jgi:hypothetical protein
VDNPRNSVPVCYEGAAGQDAELLGATLLFAPDDPLEAPPDEPADPEDPEPDDPEPDDPEPDDPEPDDPELEDSEPEELEPVPDEAAAPFDEESALAGSAFAALSESAPFEPSPARESVR